MRYVLYSSEDEGFRFPVGKPSDTKDHIMSRAAKYLKREHRGDKLPTLVTKFTKKQIENTCPPNCHGKVVAIACLDGDEYLEKMNDSESGYAYDWLYVIKI